MCDEQVEVRLARGLAIQRQAELPDSGSRVEDQDFAARQTDFDARRVPAEAEIRRAGSGERSTDSPESDREMPGAHGNLVVRSLGIIPSKISRTVSWVP